MFKTSHAVGLDQECRSQNYSGSFCLCLRLVAQFFHGPDDFPAPEPILRYSAWQIFFYVSNRRLSGLVVLTCL